MPSSGYSSSSTWDDALFCQAGGRSADGAEIKSAVLVARIGHHGRAVPFGQHHQRSPLSLKNGNVTVHACGRGGTEGAGCISRRGLCGTGVVDNVILDILRQPFPLSRRSLSLAWAISRATMMLPLSSRRVATGYWVSVARILSMGWLRSMETASPPPSGVSGRYRAGSASSCSRKMPALVILALMLRSALQLTPMPMGQLTRRGAAGGSPGHRAKYLPPNWAPIPSCLGIAPAGPLQGPDP
jgi:hypothetical protein